jgi:hypothetical protein
MEMLDEFLGSLGHQLPDDYLAFLKQWNGVDFGIENIAVRFTDDPDEYSFGTLICLYGIGADLDLRHSGKPYAFAERVPDGFLAIGDDGAWDRLALCLNEDRFGHVFYWRPGIPWEEEENVQTEAHLHPVAHSFGDFWDGLYVSEFPPD